MDALADAIEAGGGNARRVFCASLRSAGPEVYGLLDGVDALIVTVLAAGGTVAGDASAGGDEDAWDVAALAALDVPVLQALCLTSSRAAWAASSAALTPMDAAMQVAVPEFDGRLITVPFSFKETGPDGVPEYVADPERAARVAGIALAHARLRHTPPARRRLAIMLSSYPTKTRPGRERGRAGHPGLGGGAAPRRSRDAGYDTGDGFPEDGDDADPPAHRGGRARRRVAHRGAARRGADAGARGGLRGLVRGTARAAAGRGPGALGRPAGRPVRRRAARSCWPGCGSATWSLMIQPPRGFGENPVAIYHDPDLPPSHHYLAAYRWLDRSFGAHAVVHLGKHGTCEWLPGKGLGLSARCAPDAVLGDLPLVYPFIVNDPGEGTQAKRRGHASDRSTT